MGIVNVKLHIRISQTAKRSSFSLPMASLLDQMEALVIAEPPQPPLTNQSSEDDIVNAVVQNARGLAASRIAVENAVISHCAKIVRSEALRLHMVEITEGREEQKLVDTETCVLCALVIFTDVY